MGLNVECLSIVLRFQIGSCHYPEGKLAFLQVKSLLSFSLWNSCLVEYIAYIAYIANIIHLINHNYVYIDFGQTHQASLLMRQQFQSFNHFVSS